MVRDRIVIVSTSEPNNPRLACRRRGRQQVLPAVPAAGASPLPGGRDEEVSRFRSSPYGRNLAGLPRPLPARQGLFSGFRSLAELRRASIEARPFFGGARYGSPALLCGYFRLALPGDRVSVDAAARWPRLSLRGSPRPAK